jgi:hypothetical protein
VSPDVRSPAPFRRRGTLLPDHITFAVREDARPAVPAHPELAVPSRYCAMRGVTDPMSGFFLVRRPAVGAEVELLAPPAGRAGTAAS